MEDHGTIKMIRESGYLPVIPTHFGDIIKLLLEPYEYNINDCIELFIQYEELGNALIQALKYHSNLNREFLSVKDAILYLGAKNARVIAIAHITRQLLPDNKGRAKNFNNRNYWKHCMGTSIAGYLIAMETGLSDKDKMYTYGLIHDIRVTVLDICLPELMDQIFAMQKKGVHQIAAEKVVLNGMTHADIGMWLCREWGLPNEIAEVVGYHHTPFRSTQNSDEVKIMHLADAISSTYYERLMGNETTFLYSEAIRKSLKLSKEYINGLLIKLPKEVSKLNDMLA